MSYLKFVLLLGCAFGRLLFVVWSTGPFVRGGGRCVRKGRKRRPVEATDSRDEAREVDTDASRSKEEISWASTTHKKI